MSIRKASTTLAVVPVTPPLVDREVTLSERDWGVLEWQGEVRLAADRAVGISAAVRQRHVRAGLFERALALGADHCAGPHRARPEVARRFLAHVDALAEAGLTTRELMSLAGEAELENAGTLWAITLLFGCLESSDTLESFEAFLDALDPALFATYRGVLELTEALILQPNYALRGQVRRWAVAKASPLRAAVALEMMSPDELPTELLSQWARSPTPIVRAALERLISRWPGEAPPSILAEGGHWLEMDVPALAWEVVRARLLRRDSEPLFLVRLGDERALRALGPYALDVLALVGDGTDMDLARSIAMAQTTSPALLDAMGRVGLPSLFPRLLAAIEDEELDEDAHRALETAIGPMGPRPSKEAWEHMIAALPRFPEAIRLRGGEPHVMGAILEEIKRPDLSAPEVRVRADEVLVRASRPAGITWEAFGAPLEKQISELARLAR